jgi:hypothetical protein
MLTTQNIHLNYIALCSYLIKERKTLTKPEETIKEARRAEEKSYRYAEKFRRFEHIDVSLVL